MDRRAITWTMGVNLAIVVLGWALVAWDPSWLNNSVIFGVSLGAVGIVTFFGFYSAHASDAPARDPRLRNAIAAAFVMFYLVLLTQLFGSPSLRQSLTRDVESSFGQDIFNGFTTFVGVILGFYFAAWTADSLTRTIQSESTTREAIKADTATAAAVLASRGVTPMSSPLTSAGGESGGTGTNGTSGRTADDSAHAATSS
jgi:hypothetical protein